MSASFARQSPCCQHVFLLLFFMAAVSPTAGSCRSRAYLLAGPAAVQFLHDDWLIKQELETNLHIFMDKNSIVTADPADAFLSASKEPLLYRTFFITSQDFYLIIELISSSERIIKIIPKLRCMPITSCENLLCL